MESSGRVPNRSGKNRNDSTEKSIIKVNRTERRGTCHLTENERGEATGHRQMTPPSLTPTPDAVNSETEQLYHGNVEASHFYGRFARKRSLFLLLLFNYYGVAWLMKYYPSFHVRLALLRV
ncbi:hypothetical protein Trydic_g6859 [Trypoxylus dichotomus]